MFIEDVMSERKGLRRCAVVRGFVRWDLWLKENGKWTKTICEQRELFMHKPAPVVHGRCGRLKRSWNMELKKDRLFFHQRFSVAF